MSGWTPDTVHAQLTKPSLAFTTSTLTIFIFYHVYTFHVHLLAQAFFQAFAVGAKVLFQGFSIP